MPLFKKKVEEYKKIDMDAQASVPQAIPPLPIMKQDYPPQRLPQLQQQSDEIDQLKKMIRDREDELYRQGIEEQRQVQQPIQQIPQLMPSIPQLKEQLRWAVENVPIQTAPMLVNKSTGKQIDIVEAIALILNKLE